MSKLKMPLRSARKLISKTQIAFRAVPKAISKTQIGFRTGSVRNVKIRNPDQERPGQHVEVENALAKLGTSLDQAIFTALSRKGPRHLSKTLATQTGMTNKWLENQGLLSIKTLWVNMHYPATAR